ncbi:MAG: hypothetical protein QOG98_2654 [Pseudonocardiales bacterium]|nr:hypothetical protein [Pseudonocardiales bacterium]
MNEQRNLEGISALVTGPLRASAGQQPKSSAGIAARSSWRGGLQPRFGGDEQLRDGVALCGQVGVHVTRFCLLVGGPTRDKPTVTLTTPADPDRASAFVNIGVADIGAAYAEWSARGAGFLTEPKDDGGEIRAYVRDPDGHLIEVGQTTGLLS